MKRTLMAIGIAVLVSMMFAPHDSYWHLLTGTTGLLWKRFPVFSVNEYSVMEGGLKRPYYDNLILWSPFAGQTAFLAVLAAVAVNLRFVRRHKRPVEHYVQKPFPLPGWLTDVGMPGHVAIGLHLVASKEMDTIIEKALDQVLEIRRCTRFAAACYLADAAEIKRNKLASDILKENKQ